MDKPTIFSQEPDNVDAVVAAARWLDRLKVQTTQEEIAAFEAWCSADQHNAQTYAEVKQGLDWARDLKDTPEMLAIRHEALARLVARDPRRTWVYALAACYAALLIAGSSWLIAVGIARFERRPAAQLASAPDTLTYKTRVGERMSVTLTDGSVIHLNTQSIVQVRYGEAERRLTLIGGEALFEVAKAPERPFVVLAGERTVTALGTQFDVRLDGPRMQVALLEGSVLVNNRRPASDTAIRMRPNEVLAALGNQVAVTRYPDLQRFTSWKDGTVVFEETPLAEAIAELNRYSDRTMAIADPRLEAIRISGSFPAGQTANFLEAIQILFPVKIATETQGRIILTYRG